MRVSIQQPQYLPYIGFFHKLMLSDIHVILDDVTYGKNTFVNRNRIKTPQGAAWITIPMRVKRDQMIKEYKIDNTRDWRRKHLNAIKTNYGGAPFFKDYREFFDDYYKKEWVNLVELDAEALEYIAKQLNINVKFIRSSKLGITTTETQRLIDICNAVEADTYISGIGGKEYMDGNLFKTNNITLIYQDFKHPVYKQRFGKFEEFMSIIDLLFNHGKESTEIIKNSGLLNKEIK